MKSEIRNPKAERRPKPEARTGWLARLLDPCRRHRQSICLLAAGAVAEPERDEIEKHLAGCADCRKYHQEIRAVTGPLAKWERTFAPIEPSQAARNRWVQAIDGAEGPQFFAQVSNLPPRRFPIRRARKRMRCPDDSRLAGWIPAIQQTGSLRCLATAIRAWCADVIWPCRWVWTGLAAVWMAILVGNMALREPPHPLAANPSRSPQAMIRALKDRQSVLAEILADHPGPREADRQKFLLPKPRTEHMKLYAA